MMRRSLQLAVVFAVVALFASPAFADGHDYNPWKHLKEGDWATYKSEPTPGMVSETKQVVTKVDGEKITYEVHTKMIMNGKPLGEPTKTVQTIDLSEKPGAPGEKPKVKRSKDDVDVNGKKLACHVTETETEVAGTKYVTKMWMCKDVPFGTVKVEANGKVSMQLVDWGGK